MAWLAPSPLNSFSADGLAVRVTPNGTVAARGVLQYSGLAPSLPAFKLPSEMCPSVELVLPLRGGVEPDLAYPHARLIVRPNGDALIDLRRAGVRPPDAPLSGPWEPVTISVRLDGTFWPAR